MEKAKNSKKNILIKIFPFAVAALIMLWFYNNYQKFSLETLIEYPLDLLGLILGLYFIYIVLSILNNIIIFSGWGYKVSFFKIFLISFASGASNYLGPMKLNLPLKMYLQKKILNLPYNISSSTKLVLIITDVIALVFFSCFYLAGGEYSIFVTLLPFFGFTTGLVFAIYLAKKVNVETRFKLINRFIDFIRKTMLNLTQIKIRVLAYIFAVVFIRRIISSFSTFLIIYYYTDAISFPDMLAAHSFATLIGILSFMPMGLGVKDITFMEILKSNGITGEISFAVIIIERFVWTLIPIILGISSMFFISRKYNISWENNKKDSYDGK